jgi:hypothetical protein
MQCPFCFTWAKRPPLQGILSVLDHAPEGVDAEVRPLRAISLTFPVDFVVVELAGGGVGARLLRCPAHGEDCALGWVTLPEQSWHQSIILRIILLACHFLLDVIVTFLFTLAKGVPEEVLGPTALSCLLFQDVSDQVLVPLQESVRINLPMPYLLLPVSLDAAQQCLKLVLLPLKERSFFLGELLVQLTLHAVDFFLFQFSTDYLYFFSVHVVFDAEVDLLLLPEFNDLFVPSMFVVELLRDEGMHVSNLLLVLGLQLLHQLISSTFIVCHVFIPCFGELLVLESLCIFYID